jgi:PAS domain S-box-containing protein
MLADIERLKADLEGQVRAHAESLLAAYQHLEREMAVRRTSERAQFHLAAIVESADDAIISKNLCGIIQSWNPGAERLFGYCAEEIVGKPITCLLPEGHEDEEAVILGRLWRGERIEHYESVRRRKDGSLFPVSLTISPIRDDDGTIIGASKIARDLTDRRRLEAQATLVAQLQAALAEVKTLRGLVPICAWCKKIRDDDGYWQQLESYLRDHTEATFSHGICPQCHTQNLAGLNAPLGAASDA